LNKEQKSTNVKTKKKYHYHIPALIAVFAILFAGVFVVGAYLGNDSTGLFSLNSKIIPQDNNVIKVDSNIITANNNIINTIKQLGENASCTGLPTSNNTEVKEIVLKSMDKVIIGGIVELSNPAQAQKINSRVIFYTFLGDSMFKTKVLTKGELGLFGQQDPYSNINITFNYCVENVIGDILYLKVSVPKTTNNDFVVVDKKSKIIIPSAGSYEKVTSWCPENYYLVEHNCRYFCDDHDCNNQINPNFEIIEDIDQFMSYAGQPNFKDMPYRLNCAIKDVKYYTIEATAYCKRFS